MNGTSFGSLIVNIKFLSDLAEFYYFILKKSFFVSLKTVSSWYS